MTSTSLSNPFTPWCRFLCYSSFWIFRSSISFLFLLSSFTNNAIWLTYAIKADDPNLLFISFLSKRLRDPTRLAMTLTFAYILTYLSMKRRFNDLFLFLASIPLIAVCFASITPLIVAGTAASVLNTFNYLS